MLLNRNLVAVEINILWLQFWIKMQDMENITTLVILQITRFVAASPEDLPS